jgi:hypothetical protein
MQHPQVMRTTADARLLHSFLRNSSRSPSAYPIQPLPSEFLEATPLATSREARKTARFWKARFRRKLPCETLGRWIRSPPNPRGSDLADPNDHNQTTSSRAKASRIPPAGLPTRLQPRAVQLPRRPGPANSAAAEPRHSRGTPHAQEDGPGDLRRKPSPFRATHCSRRFRPQRRQAADPCSRQ